MKKYPILNINPSNMIVLKFHMFLLYIYHQTVSKQFFLVDESRYQQSLLLGCSCDQSHGSAWGTSVMHYTL